MASNKRKYEFNAKTRKKIIERDHGMCIFCQMNYEMEEATWLDLQLDGIMHYVPRSHQGLGIEKNGALGCHWHHHMLDNDHKGRGKTMKKMFKAYLEGIYPDWNEDDLTNPK